MNNDSRKNIFIWRRILPFYFLWGYFFSNNINMFMYISLFKERQMTEDWIDGASLWLSDNLLQEKRIKIQCYLIRTIVTHQCIHIQSLNSVWCWYRNTFWVYFIYSLTPHDQRNDSFLYRHFRKAWFHQYSLLTIWFPGKSMIHYDGQLIHSPLSSFLIWVAFRYSRLINYLYYFNSLKEYPLLSIEDKVTC